MSPEPQIHRFTTRGPRLWKVLDGALDMLPSDGMTEAELMQWLEFVGQALRRYYNLPAIASAPGGDTA